MIRKAILSIPEVENILKKKILDNTDIPKKAPKSVQNELFKELQFTNICGEEIHTFSDRYKVFFIKGYKCSKCGLEGKFFALEKSSENEKRYHLNLYGIDKDGNEVLMTKDHIIPRSLGGKNTLDNYQPMCVNCNVKKGNYLE